MYSSPAWLTYVIAFAPAPNAQCPGLPAGARAKARACPVFDCNSNFAEWQTLQAWLPAYCGVAIAGTAASSSKTVCPSRTKKSLLIAVLQYSAGACRFVSRYPHELAVGRA